MLQKPAAVFDREQEWAELARFLEDPAREPRLMVVYGRRRQGKSLLLQELARKAGGLYWEAAQQSREQNLASFSAAWSRWTRAPGPYRFASWEEAIETVFAHSGPHRRPALLLDEVGYLVETAPEVPSLLQRRFGPTTAAPPVRMILCGSVFAQMTRLLGAGQPLRGRQSRNLRVDPFPFRVAARFWGLDDHPDAAFRLHALIGGTPAYKRFAGGEAPRHGNVDEWVVRHLLDPGSPLYFEGSLLVAEDPTLVDKALYWSVLNAVADGGRRRGEIAATIGRPDTALSQPLASLVEGAWVEQRPDPLHRRASTILLTEPMLRTHRLLIAPERARLDRGEATAVWQDAQPRLARAAYRPHLEWLAAEWALRHADPDSVGGSLRSVGATVLRSAGQRHQLDLVGVEPDRHGNDRVCVVSEAKAEREPMGIGELERLDAVIALVARRAKAQVKRLLVARGGFTSELRRTARRRRDVELVDLDRLYRGA
jgi:AAA+ ATPase superfamily predicted ATPase